MNKVLSIALLLFISLTTNAQDKKAKDLLDQVTAKVKTYKNISIDFKYTLTNTKENINKESKGNLVLEGNKYVLNFLGVTKIYDGKKSYTIVPEDEEITISSVNDKDENTVTPAKMLTFFNSFTSITGTFFKMLKGVKFSTSNWFLPILKTNAKRCC